MAVSMVDVGAKYPFAFTDAAGNFLSGAKAYRLHPLIAAESPVFAPSKSPFNARDKE